MENDKEDSREMEEEIGPSGKKIRKHRLWKYNYRDHNTIEAERKGEERERERQGKKGREREREKERERERERERESGGGETLEEKVNHFLF